MKVVAFLIASLLALAAIFLCSGCAGYQQFASGYTRTYSLGYTDAQGRTVNTGATFSPVGSGFMPLPNPKGLSK